MPHYQHILITIDYADSDQIVIAKAIGMAASQLTALSLLHVLDNIAMPDTPYGTQINLNENSDYPLLEAEKHRLKQLADQLGIDHNHAWLIWGSPQQEIIRLAQQQHIDLIVMGFHTRHGLQRLLGTTANGVLHRAPCDLLAVHLPSN